MSTPTPSSKGEKKIKGESVTNCNQLKKKIYRHLRINKDGIHQYFDAYHPYNEWALKKVPNKYWKNDLPENGLSITNIFIDEVKL